MHYIPYATKQKPMPDNNGKLAILLPRNSANFPLSFQNSVDKFRRQVLPFLSHGQSSEMDMFGHPTELLATPNELQPSHKFTNG